MKQEPGIVIKFQQRASHVQVDGLCIENRGSSSSATTASTEKTSSFKTSLRDGKVSIFPRLR